MAWSAALIGLTARPANPLAVDRSERVFYVDTQSGNDGANGRSPRTAFRTIGKALDRYGPLGPGDRVRIAEGLYRESLFVAKSGTAERPIVIEGEGRVVIDASAAAKGWERVAGEIYRIRPGFPVTAVVVDEQPLFPEFGRSALAAGRYFYDRDRGELFLWCPGGGDPSGRDVGLVKDDEYQAAIALDGASHLVIRGLTVRFAGGPGIKVLGDHVRVERCRVRFNGTAGIIGFGYGSVSSIGLAVVGNDVYHNVLRNWPRGRYKFGGWASGVSSTAPETLFEGNTVHRNGGEGLVAYLGRGGTIIRGNTVSDNWSVGIYVDNQPHARIERNFVYNESPLPGDLYNNGDPAPGDGRCLRRLRSEGIMTADEKYDVRPPANLREVVIVNNVIVNCRRGITHYGAAPGSGLKGVKVLHNTVVVPRQLFAAESDVCGISIPFNEGNNEDAVYRDNLVYAVNPATYVLCGSTGSAAKSESFRGLQLDHNLWFHAARARPFRWGPDGRAGFDFDHDGWAALSGVPHALGDVAKDPRLVKPGSVERAEDQRPAPGSPALDAGVDAGVQEDFLGRARPVDGRFDMGAFEQGAAIPH